MTLYISFKIIFTDPLGCLKSILMPIFERNYYMSRQPKDFEYLSCKLDREISEKFTDFCEKTARNKTAALEMILKEYLQNEGYEFTKK